MRSSRRTNAAMIAALALAAGTSMPAIIPDLPSVKPKRRKFNLGLSKSEQEAIAKHNEFIEFKKQLKRNKKRDANSPFNKD